MTACECSRALRRSSDTLLVVVTSSEPPFTVPPVLLHPVPLGSAGAPEVMIALLPPLVPLLPPAAALAAAAAAAAPNWLSAAAAWWLSVEEAAWWGGAAECAGAWCGAPWDLATQHAHNGCMPAKENGMATALTATTYRSSRVVCQRKKKTDEK